MNNESRVVATRIADAMSDAMSRRDAEAYGLVYAETATVWHNTDRTTQTKTENVAMLAAIMHRFSAMRYSDISHTFTGDGFVQQHVLIGTLVDGRSIEIPACLIVKITDGQVSHIDEYLDPTPSVALITG